MSDGLSLEQNGPRRANTDLGVVSGVIPSALPDPNALRLPGVSQPPTSTLQNEPISQLASFAIFTRGALLNVGTIAALGSAVLVAGSSRFWFVGFVAAAVITAVNSGRERVNNYVRTPDRDNGLAENKKIKRPEAGPGAERDDTKNLPSNVIKPIITYLTQRFKSPGLASYISAVSFVGPALQEIPTDPATSVIYAGFATSLLAVAALVNKTYNAAIYDGSHVV